MKLPLLKKNLSDIPWNYKALAFAFPFLAILLVMIISGYAPFGPYSMLYSDSYHQYYPFLKAFRQALLEGKSLLYTWDIGMGMDYIGLYSYYAASPLNLLCVLVPEKLMLTFYSLLLGVKLGLAGLFFAIFLQKLYGKNDFSLSLFGTLYGLCAWALGYQWNIMWLDSFALLPLVALGTVYLLRDKKFILYTVALFLSVFSNYYVGFFVCIFVLLLFVCYEICRFRGFKRLFLDLCRIALFSLLAIGMTAILELPTLAALQDTYSSASSFPTGFKLNIADENTWKGLLDAMRQVAGNLGGGAEPNFKEGLPNIYCGISTVLLTFLFLTTRGTRLRDKLCCVFLLLFFTLSFILRQLDYIWHGFHFTNMIPYRFSFLFSFVMLYMAYRAWLLRHRFRTWQLLGAGILMLGIVACSEDRTDPVYLVYNLGFLSLYLFAGIYGWYRKRLPREATAEAVLEIRADRFERRSAAKSMLAAIIALEMILNVVNFGLNFSGTRITNYPKGTDSTESMIRYMKEREADTPFYRSEVTFTQTLNDGALLDYHGVSTFTSSANVKVTEFMQDLGYAALNSYNRYCYEIGSPVSELFLNLKYLIDRDKNPVDNPYYQDLHHYNDVHLLESNIYLPLGFLTDSALGELDFSGSKGDFSFQNDLFRAATGLNGNVWNILPTNNDTVTATDVTVSSKSTTGLTTYRAGDNGGTVSYRYTALQDGYMCVYLNLQKKNDFTVLINGKEIYNDSISLTQIAAVGSVTAGDEVEIRIKCKSKEDSRMTVRAAILNDALFRQGYGVLCSSTWDPEVFSETYLSGTVTCDRDGLLYTSIPQNGNWSATVDGEPAEITLVGDAMIGVKLTAGEHEIAFSYHNDALALGWKISLACALVFAGIAYLVYCRSGKKGKFQR